MMPIRVLHLITGLGTGGAELMLLRLLPSLDAEALVVSMTDQGALGARLLDLGIPVFTLGMQPGRPSPLGFARLVRLIREWRPDVVQTWMYHADLLGGLAGRLVPGTPVIWNLRQSAVFPSELRRGTVLTIRACAALSRRLPERIVSCSTVGRDFHAELGYARDRIVVIPNGFDLDRFRPDLKARQSMRQQLGLAEGALLVGCIARFDPQKDHRNLIAAAAHLGRRRSDVAFLLCGDGMDGNNRELCRWIEGAGLQGRVHLLGRRDDVWRVLAALDVATSSSLQEGFPNAVGEAMACGIPCVVTDVGDSAELVGPAGVVVPPRDAEALAAGWESLLRLEAAERQRRGHLGRRRIEERFSLPFVAGRYQSLYEEVASRAGGATAPSRAMRREGGITSG